MSDIENYYDLLHRLDNSDFRIVLYTKPEEEDDLDNEKKNNAILNQDLENLKMKLSEKSDEADRIRIMLIGVANSVLNSFEKIKKWGAHYPDLNQGMIVPGYLFGKILNDFNITIKYEIGLPKIDIYMSRHEWPYEQLQAIIQHIHDDLSKTNFATKLEAIEYYEYIKESFFKIVDSLRQNGVF